MLAKAQIAFSNFSMCKSVRRNAYRSHVVGRAKKGTIDMSGVACEISNCPRCEGGVCELSKLDSKHEHYRHPSQCAHRKWKHGAAERRGGGESSA
jgi:hypothetical protein